LLSGLLRISYGEGMLKPVLAIMAKMMKTQDVIVKNQLVKPNFNEKATINLVWPQWYDPSIQDEQVKTQDVIAAHDAGLISHKTAINNISDQFGVLDIDEELVVIEAEQAKIQAEQQPVLQESMKV